MPHLLPEITCFREVFRLAAEIQPPYMFFLPPSIPISVITEKLMLFLRFPATLVFFNKRPHLHIPLVKKNHTHWITSLQEMKSAFISIINDKPDEGSINHRRSQTKKKNFIILIQKDAIKIT